MGNFPTPLNVLNGTSKIIVTLDADAQEVIVRDDLGNEAIRLKASGATAELGGNTHDGDIRLYTQAFANPTTDQAMAHLGAKNGALTLRTVSPDDPSAAVERIYLAADSGNVRAGGNGKGGDVYLFMSYEKDTGTLGNARVHIGGENGNLTLRSVEGVEIRGGGFLPSSYLDRIRLVSDTAAIWVGGNGADGDVRIFASGGDNSSTSGDKGPTIHLNGEDGDIVLRNADCAEEFDSVEGVEAGTVMIIDGEEALRPSDGAYDRRVAGVVSGAGSYRPGIVLDRRAEAAGRRPIALLGKVFCKVDATHGAIAVGDLLTTSPTPGHAMKAADPTRTTGAVLGKALRPLAGGVGLIPILVSLQ
jgi:hypothetical protein